MRSYLYKSGFKVTQISPLSPTSLHKKYFFARFLDCRVTEGVWPEITDAQSPLIGQDGKIAAECHDFWSKSLSRRLGEIERENRLFCPSRRDLHGVILR